MARSAPRPPAPPPIGRSSTTDVSTTTKSTRFQLSERYAPSSPAKPYSGEEARRTAPKSKGWFAKPKGKGRKKQDDDDAAHCFPSALGVGATRAGVGLVARLLKMHPMVHGPGASLRFFGGRDERHPLDYAMHPSFALSKAQRRSSHVTFEASPEYGVRPGALREEAREGAGTAAPAD